MSIQVQFTGTGTSQGIPVISCQCKVCTSKNEKDQRLRTSVLISNDDTTISIDCSPDFRTQMLRAHVLKLDGIVFTHEHQDHVSGLDDVRAFNFTSKKDVKLYATNRVQKRLKHMFDYAFLENKYPGAPSLELNTITDASFNVGSLLITPIKMMHGSWPVLGFRIGDFVYITDANKIEEEEFEKIYDAKVIVVNALRREAHHSHFNLEQAVDVVKKSKASHGYLTHVSHQMGLHSDVNIELPDNIQLAYDGLKLDV